MVKKEKQYFVLGCNSQDTCVISRVITERITKECTSHGLEEKIWIATKVNVKAKRNEHKTAESNIRKTVGVKNPSMFPNFIKSELSGDENVENLIVVMVAQLYEYTESQWVIQFNGWIL